MSLSRSILCTILLSIIALGVHAQKKNNSDTMIFGDVKDVSGNHVPFATIMVEGTTIGVAADGTGHFKLVNLPEGTIKLKASAVGYAPQIKILNLKNGKTTEVYFSLKEDAIQTEEVVITASRYAQSRKEAPVIVNTISPELFSATGSPSLAEGLNFVPGLRMENDCQNCGFTQLRLNGLDGPYTQFLINSRPVFSSLAGVYGLEMFPSNMIDRVEVVRGGGSALYGANAIGGTVNVITRDPISNTYMIGTEMNVIDLKAIDASVKFNTSMVTDDYKGGMFIYGLHREREPYNANPDDTYIDGDNRVVKDDFSEIVKLKSTVVGLNSYYRPNDLSRFNVDFSIINDDRRGGNKFDEKPDQADVAEEVKHTIVTGGISYDLYSKNSKNRYSLYSSAQNVERHSYYGADRDPSAYGYTHGLTTVIGGQYTRHLDNAIIAPSILIAGVENVYDMLNDKKLGYYDYNDAIAPGYRPTNQVADQSVNSIGAYVQNEWDLGWWKLLTGLRYDRGAVTDHEKREGSSDKTDVYEHISPRANVLFKLSEDFQVRLSYAGGFRFPQIFDEDLHIESSTARTIIHKNSPDLKPETSHNVTGGFDYDFKLFGSSSELIIEGFYTVLQDPFAPSFDFDDATKVTTVTRINAESKAIVTGSNIEFKTSLGKDANLQLGFTVQKSEYSDSQEWGEDPKNTSKQILRTPSNYGYFVLNYEPIHHFTTTLTGTYTGEMHVPHLTGGFYEGKEITEETLVKTPKFMDVGLKLAYDFHISKGTCLEVSAGMKNIFNQFQNDFDSGSSRDAGYVYGPKQPRTIFFGIKLGNALD
ncbi:MAG: TonB-dependent receptor domain-containing protein [Hyphomicrobiales bacterium]